jgi:signal transduction histidine kinase
MLGREPNGLIGQLAIDMVAPRDVGRFEAAASRVATGQMVSLSRLRLLHQDGRGVVVDGTLAPVLDDTGVLSMVLWIAHDVTQQNEVAEERRRLLARLLVAQEEERLRIAGDIHDDPIQAMTAAGFRIASLRRLLTEPDQEEALDRVAASVSKTVDRLRHLMFELRPPSLDNAGIAAALRDFIDKEARDQGFTFALESRLPSEPARETRSVVYRMAQEALVNIRKHAQARHVMVRLDARNDGILTHIEDDGVGFDVSEPVPQAHMGLASIRERSTLAGGWFRVESAPGAGTIVEFWVPSSSEAD